MARKCVDLDCTVVAKEFTPAKEKREYIINGVPKVYEATPDKYVVKVLGGVSCNPETGYENAYLKTVVVDKDKYDMTKIGDKVKCEYNYMTQDGKDVFKDFEYSLIKK